MPRPLPLLDSSRFEFGFTRTTCACQECQLNCQHIPGYLVPADLQRIQQHVGPDADIVTWAMSHLLASPGAKVMRDGQVFRVPTLVPARQASGSCIFLTPDNRCSIHAVAPFGCAFFDCRQSKFEADQRSLHGLHAICVAWAGNDLYAQIWLALDAAGRHAPSP